MVPCYRNHWYLSISSILKMALNSLLPGLKLEWLIFTRALPVPGHERVNVHTTVNISRLTWIILLSSSKVDLQSPQYLWASCCIHLLTLLPALLAPPPAPWPLPSSYKIVNKHSQHQLMLAAPPICFLVNHKICSIYSIPSKSLYCCSVNCCMLFRFFLMFRSFSHL